MLVSLRMKDWEADTTSKDKIYRELRRVIIMGHRQPNERLDIQAIAQTFGSSVTPVRDALHMLAQEGLVSIKSRSGYFVTNVTLKELRDMLEMREILEVAAIERAVENVTEVQIEQLERIHAGYTGDDDESYDRYTEENRRFHFLIAEASGNTELAAALGHLHDRLARFMVLRRAGATQDRTHALIVAAIRARDAEAARLAMLAELNETRDILLERIMRREGVNWGIGSVGQLDASAASLSPEQSPFPPHTSKRSSHL